MRNVGMRIRNRILRRYPNAGNLVVFKYVKSLERRIRCQGRTESWHSGINSYTQERKVWNDRRRLKGQQIHSLHLVNEGDTLDDHANTLGEHSSSEQYSKSVLKFKEMAEGRTLEHKSRTNEQYNSTFNIDELRAALNSCHSTQLTRWSGTPE